MSGFLKFCTEAVEIVRLVDRNYGMHTGKGGAGKPPYWGHHGIFPKQHFKRILMLYQRVA